MKKIITGIGSILLILGMTLFALIQSMQGFLIDDFSDTLVTQLQSKDYVHEMIGQLEVNDFVKPMMESMLTSVMQDPKMQTKTKEYVKSMTRSMLGDEVEDLGLNEDIKELLLESEPLLYTLTSPYLSETQIHSLLIEVANQIDLESIYEQEINEVKASLPNSVQLLLKGMHLVYNGVAEVISFCIIIAGLLCIVFCNLHSYRWVKYLGISSMVSGVMLIIVSKLLPQQLVINSSLKQMIEAFENVLINHVWQYGVYAGGIGFGLLVLYNCINVIKKHKE